MIRYEPGDWFTFLFRFHRSDTLRRLFPLILAIAAYSGLIAYLELEVWKLNEKSEIRHISQLHALLGFVISMLLVFRTNTAYERWWEGRRLWGQLVNNTRNLCIKLSGMLPPDHAERAFFREALPAFAECLRGHLRSEQTRSALFDNLPPRLQRRIDVQKHLPNQLAAAIVHHVQALAADGTLNYRQVQMLNEELRTFADVCGACERIKNTPIPYSYSTFIKKFIFFYIMTLPFGFVFTLGYYVVPLVAFVFYTLASLELIAEEIEDPFDGDDNDLPLEKMVHNLRTHIGELI